MSLDFAGHLRTDSARFRDILATADLRAQVVSCPDWLGEDLLYHVAEVFLFWARVVAARADDPDSIDGDVPAKPAGRAELFALYDDCIAQLQAALESTPDDVPVWTWASDPDAHTAAFVRRRMAHEALIHRLDAELLVGARGGVDPALAADGVLEMLQHFFHPPGWAQYRPAGAVGRLVATDTGDSWLVEVGGFSGLSPNTGKTYADEPCARLAAAGAPTFTLSATAADLDAWLWNRPPEIDPAVEGDEADFRAFAGVIAKGIQ